MSISESSLDAGLKRKVPAHPGASRKRAKVTHHSADDLPWKSVFRPKEAGMGGDEGILEFEEVDDVEVVYEETEHGKVVKFNVRTSLII
jgi:ATP-dependent RNA helicase DDX24/MAK5